MRVTLIKAGKSRPGDVKALIEQTVKRFGRQDVPASLFSLDAFLVIDFPPD